MMDSFIMPLCYLIHIFVNSIMKNKDCLTENDFDSIVVECPLETYIRKEQIPTYVTIFF